MTSKTNVRIKRHALQLLPIVAALWGALGLADPALSQESPAPPALTPEAAVAQALVHSPALDAARRRLDAAEAVLQGAGAPFPFRVELAHGVGFTNGNSILSKQIDLGGTRSARWQRAVGERDAALAEVDVLRRQVAFDARAAYFDLVRVRANEASAREMLILTEQVLTLVRQRVEIGEAPTVQATRAEIEVERARQEVIRAGAEAEARRAVLNRLIGQNREQLLTLSEGLNLPDAPNRPLGEVVEEAVARRPEAAAIQGRIAARRGEVELARSLLRPTLFAEVATDFWSLDREPFRGRNVGLQARLNFPLGGDRSGRADVERARALVAEGEAELEILRRAIALDVEQAAGTLSAAREVAQNYQESILPRTQDLHRATRSGFESGLVTFLEVLEAQRVLRQTQVEAQNALYEAVRARLALDAALGVDPVPHPDPNETVR